MLALLSLIVIPSLFSTANGVTITTESNNKIVLNGTKLELEWTVNPSSGDGIISRNVYLVPDFNNPIILGTTVEPKGQELFGENRLSATFADPKYTMTLKDVKYNETGTFRFSVFFQNNGLNATVSDIRVVVTAPTTPRPTVTPTPTDKGKIKGGIIAIIVIAAITFVALIVVGIVLFLRWKKNHPSKTDTSEQMKSLKTNKSTEEGVHYASTDVTVPPEKRDQQVYAQVDRSGGGGRDGPKPEVVKSDYAQMQVDADGYPASGPTSSTPPDENEDGISSGVMV